MSMLLVWTNERTPGLRAGLFVPIMTVTMEIELQVPPTPQLVKRGVDLTYTGPMEARMIAGFLWFQGTFAQFWYYTSLGKGEYSARLSRSEVGRTLKKNKKKRQKQQF